MKLNDLLTQYIAFRQSLGENFTSQARVLRHFGRFIGTDLEIADVRTEQIKAFLNGERPLTCYWHRKFSILRGFYNYAIGRGLATSSPLPEIIPKRTSSHKPYIFSQDELRRLLDGTVSFRKRTRQIEPQTLRTLLLLLYGAGLRLSEALALNQVDVDLSAALLTIRDTKFYKTRLVPLSADLSQALMNYHSRREPPWTAIDHFSLERTARG